MNLTPIISKTGIYFILTLIFGFIWIIIAKRYKIEEICDLSRYKKPIKKNFKLKNGTTTLGGIIILITLLIFTINNKINLYFTIAFIATILFLFGSLDDLAKIKNKQNFGLSWTKKLALQTIAGGVFCTIFYFSVSKSIPYFLFNIIFFVFFVNSVNIADGLNGLAIGNYIIILSFMITALYHYNNSLLINFSVILLSSCFAFLLFNFPKAKIFLGDAGASMLGGIIAMIAIIGKIKIILCFAGLFFILEGLSSFTQILSKKYLKRKILPIAPIHHYYINHGVNERKIVILSWFFTIIIGIISLLIFKII